MADWISWERAVFLRRGGAHRPPTLATAALSWPVSPRGRGSARVRQHRRWGRPAPEARVSSLRSTRPSRRAAQPRCCVLALVAMAVAAFDTHADAAEPSSAWQGPALVFPPAAAAEATAAVDPRRPDHVAVAADPYLTPARVVVASSVTAGRGWSPLIRVMPPGFAKSYDPQLLYAPDGRLLVVAGASKAGTAGCHPGSVVFAAWVDGARVRYRLVARAAGSEFLDRPMALATEAGPTVTYTVSSGPGASCRATPLRSQIRLRRLDWQLNQHGVEQRVPAASDVAYGSALTGFGAARLAVATLARLPGGATVVSVAVGAASGRGMRVTATLPAGSPAPATLPGLGGVYTSIPTLSGGPGSPLIVLWTRISATGPQVRIARSDDGQHFAAVEPPSDARAPSLLATATTTADHSLVMLLARLRPPGRVAFAPWLRTSAGRWKSLPVLASGDARGYQEIGELLGVASAGRRVVLAAPVLHSRASEITVTVRDLPDLTVPAQRMHPSDQGFSRSGSEAASRRGAGPDGSWWPWVAAGVPVSVAARLIQVRRRRRRRLRAGKTTVRLPAPKTPARTRSRR